MTLRALFTVHAAGVPVGAVQSCVSCGFVLADATPWMEGRVAVPNGQAEGPSWWPVGARVATSKTGAVGGGITYTVPEGRYLDGDERLCAGAN